MAGFVLILGPDDRCRQRFSMIVEPGRQFPLAGDFAAKNGQNQIVSNNGVELWRIGDGFVCAGRFDDEWHTPVQPVNEGRPQRMVGADDQLGFIPLP